LIDRIQPYWLQTKNQAATYQIVYGLIYGLIFGILSGFITGGVKSGLIQGIIFALFFGLILGRANYWETSIQAVESLRWSYNSVQIGLIIILLLGIIIALSTHHNDLV
jgi:F0F1-type ATP synthase assembly protein I